MSFARYQFFPLDVKLLTMQVVRKRRGLWAARLYLGMGFLLCVLGLGPGCQPGTVEAEGLEIGSAVQLLTTTEGDLAEQALKRLVRHGRTALPYLEAALHHASPSGRRHAAMAMRSLGLAETAPLLGHMAAFDEDLYTAGEAWRTLSLWSSERGPRGVSARAALRKVDEVRGMGALLLDPE